MKRIVILTLLAINSLFGAASARDKVKAITVVGPPTIASWSQDVSTKLNNNLAFPHAMATQSNLTGFTHVRFRADANGKPTDLVVARKSGIRALDLAAMQAVAQIKSLHPLPKELASDRMIEARLYFASSPEDLQYWLRVDQRESASRAAQIAEAGPPPLILSIGAGSSVKRKG